MLCRLYTLNVTQPKSSGSKQIYVNKEHTPRAKHTPSIIAFVDHYVYSSVKVLQGICEIDFHLDGVLSKYYDLPETVW